MQTYIADEKIDLHSLVNLFKFKIYDSSKYIYVMSICSDPSMLSGCKFKLTNLVFVFVYK